MKRHGMLISMMAALLPYHPVVDLTGRAHLAERPSARPRPQVRFRSDGLLHLGIAKARRRGRLKGRRSR